MNKHLIHCIVEDCKCEKWEIRMHVRGAIKGEKWKKIRVNHHFRWLQISDFMKRGINRPFICLFAKHLKGKTLMVTSWPCNLRFMLIFMGIIIMIAQLQLQVSNNKKKNILHVIQILVVILAIYTKVLYFIQNKGKLTIKIMSFINNKKNIIYNNKFFANM